MRHAQVVAVLALVSAPWVVGCANDAVSEETNVQRMAVSTELTLARAIADRYVTEHAPESLGWDWQESVLMTAMADLARATGDTKYRDYVRQWSDFHLRLEPVVPVIWSSDSSAPAIPNVALIRDLGKDTRYGRVVDRTFDYLDHRAVRTSDGGISHYSMLLVPPTLWADSLFMFGEIMIRAGELDGDAARLQQYSDQHRIFAANLQEAPGWFVHAKNWILAPNPEPNVYWGRGNGWVIAAASDYLRVRAERGETDATVTSSVQSLASAIVASQDASGLWWTVVNRPGETYLETSATALFAAGLARAHRIGILDASVRPVIDRAMAGLRTKIVNDAQGRPVVTGTSGPTDPGGFRNYASVKQQDDLTYGVASVIMALIEVSKLP